ncbi:MAG TPA: alpha-amylase, partial [Bacteroidales bacterium]|nr:alpha-amylase [Bacteroidales bacterium]
MKTYLLLSFLLSAGVILSSYTYFYTTTRPVSKPVSEVIHPQWSGNSVIYEVNIRQYSKEGTFAAFEKDLPRLKSLGIDVLWLMPVHP